MARKLRLWAVTVLLALAVGGTAFTVIYTDSVLRSIGWLLVTSDPVSTADVIIISTAAGGSGALEAADLVERGVAKLVAVFEDPPSGEDFEFIRRGLPYEDVAERRIQQLNMLGVMNVVKIEKDESGTEEEGRALPAWCEKQGFRTVVYVTSRDHSRRVRRVFARALDEHKARFLVRPSQYSTFNPDDWWTNRSGTRTLLIELEKLGLDVLRHPFQL